MCADESSGIPRSGDQGDEFGIRKVWREPGDGEAGGGGGERREERGVDEGKVNAQKSVHVDGVVACNGKSAIRKVRG